MVHIRAVCTASSKMVPTRAVAGLPCVPWPGVTVAARAGVSSAMLLLRRLSIASLPTSSTGSSCIVCGSSR